MGLKDLSEVVKNWHLMQDYCWLIGKIRLLNLLPVGIQIGMISRIYCHLVVQLLTDIKNHKASLFFDLEQAILKHSLSVWDFVSEIFLYV